MLMLHMPVIAYDWDILMPFLALQNTFGNVAMKNELTYNGKDYFNIIEANDFQLNKPDEAKDSVYGQHTEAETLLLHGRHKRRGCGGGQFRVLL